MDKIKIYAKERWGIKENTLFQFLSFQALAPSEKLNN